MSTTIKVVVLLYSFSQISRLSAPQINKYKYNQKIIWRDYLREKCKKHDMPYKLMLAVIKAESSEYISCLEWSSIRRIYISFGLFQVSLETADWYRWRTRKKLRYWDRAWIIQHENNIDAALFHFKYLYGKYGSWRVALSCHNMGERGRRIWKRRTGLDYYPRYIKRVEKKLGVRKKYD